MPNAMNLHFYNFSAIDEVNDISDCIVIFACVILCNYSIFKFMFTFHTRHYVSDEYTTTELITIGKKTPNISETCSICLEPMHAGQLQRLPCEHVFHRNCISMWVKPVGMGKNCPLCKHNLVVHVVNYNATCLL